MIRLRAMGRGEEYPNGEVDLASPARGGRGDTARSLADDAELRELGRLFNEICPEPDGVWTCDGGAAFGAWLCDQLGIERRLRSGFYWHPTIESYNETMGYEEDSDDWAEWRDEAHCWVEIDRSYGTVILDPNGERLPEPRPRLMSYDAERGLILADDGEWIDANYEPCNSERDCVNYAVDEDIELLAEENGDGGVLKSAIKAARARLDQLR